MLHFEQLSFWEHQQYLAHNTFVIVGAGLVGMSTALSLRERFPSEKICIIERGYLPTGASTKNAGFTCFGSPTELLDDLAHIPEQTIWDTVALRLEGLRLLKERVGEKGMNYQNCGSWDLISATELPIDNAAIGYLNLEFEKRFGLQEVYRQDDQSICKFGFKGFRSAYFNPYEGSIDTGLLIHTLYQKCIAADIRFLFATEVLSFENDHNQVHIHTNRGDLSCAELFLCTNGFAQPYFQNEMKPARAQVVVTKPLAHQLRGTFHSERGYYYFRDIGDRILLGGGRHLDFEGETTTKFESNALIHEALLKKLRTEILPGVPFEIERAWSGIMCVGNEKKPIIKSLNKNVHAGVRMGGMGVAIGSAVGKALSKLV